MGSEMKGKSLKLRVGVEAVAQVSRRPKGPLNKRKEPALTRINAGRAKSGKWSFGSLIKNLLISGRKERKEFERTEISKPFNVVHEADMDSDRLPLPFGPETRVFNNPLFNPHLDGSGDQRIHSETVKKANGQHLLDALNQGSMSFFAAIDERKVRYHFGIDKSEEKSRNFIIASIGADAARHFTASASSTLSAAVLDDIYEHGHSPARIPVANVDSIDWTFDRDHEGAVTASYDLKFKAPSGESARARGHISVDVNGKLVRASKVSVSLISQELQKGALATVLANVDNDLFLGSQA